MASSVSSSVVFSVVSAVTAIRGSRTPILLTFTDGATTYALIFTDGTTETVLTI